MSLVSDTDWLVSTRGEQCSATWSKSLTLLRDDLCLFPRIETMDREELGQGIHGFLIKIFEGPIIICECCPECRGPQKLTE